MYVTKPTQLNIMMQTRRITHIHQCKHKWPKHSSLSAMSCHPAESGPALIVNLYTVISSPLLTRHLMLWVAKCLCARTPCPLLLLVLNFYAWARNMKGQMGEKKMFPWASTLKMFSGSYLLYEVIYLFLF